MKVLLQNGKMEERDFENAEGREAFWHTSAHVMAQAVKRLYPDTKCAAGGTLENGFYYDFEFAFPFSEEYLQDIQKEMKKIAGESLSLQVWETDRAEAERYLEEKGERYQLELLRGCSGEDGDVDRESGICGEDDASEEQSICGDGDADREPGICGEDDVSEEQSICRDGDVDREPGICGAVCADWREEADIPSWKKRIVLYRQGEYAEVCEGPHISNTCHIRALELMSVAGAYWRGDERGRMLTRICGISFPKASLLEEYLHTLEEAKRRDHRKLGRQLGLFLLTEDGPGLPFFLPKGMILKNLLLDYWRGLHRREGYQEISTPVMLDRKLWEVSGHWEHYKDKMYTTSVDGREYAIKPMSCPGGMLVYQSEPRSYRDLPLRLAELGLIHRNEKSGTLHGLMRVRECTQDDAHIFMTREQMVDEIRNVAKLIHEIYTKFGFIYHVELSTRPEDSIGSEEEWELATDALRSAVEAMGMPWQVNEGDGAFYGPKLDFHLKDSIGRTWQCGTIQVDFQLPRRFGAEYTGADGEKHRPVMIHRAIFGSLERFIGILTEHYAGRFPLWLAPVQVKILPISDKYMEYAREIEGFLKEEGLRCEIDEKGEKIGYKIRTAQTEGIPYMVILGEKEVLARSVCVRKREEGDLGQITPEGFLKMLKEGMGL